MKRYIRPRLAAYCCLAVFWAIALANLDRFPPINPDEPWILSPGYKFFSQGIYGSDLFAGFYGMEEHYLEFLPLMSLVQGASARLFGLGVFQMRFAPVALGLLILATVFAIGRELRSERVGLVAVLLLLVWQWSPGGDRMRASGIPLVDVSRIARYDILAACLGLMAFYQFIRARLTEDPWRHFATGLLAGLAVFAHAYGLFWVGTLLIATVTDHWFFSRRETIKRTAWFLCGAIIPGLAWLSFIGTNWNDFGGQTIQNRADFDLQSPSFYWNNLMAEGNRYSFSLDPGRVGYWLVILGAPLALAFLFARWIFRRDRRALWLAIPCVLFPILFALLIKSKLPNYIVTMVPLFAVASAWLYVQLWEWRPGAMPALLAAILATTTIQGAGGILEMQMKASQTKSARQFFKEIDQAVPVTARALGHPQYWLALSNREYRSFVLPFILSSPYANAHPVSFASALKQIAPTIILVDAEIAHVMAERSTSDGAQFQSFLRDHNMRVLRELRDPDENQFFIYELDESR